tara:strand:+ start:6742 stop:6951 length:210 start_codon:yes stop_codon:yes gene_type:complete
MLILTTKSFACDHFDFKNEKNIQNLMGKKSKFYDAYRQGKCVLENALEPLSAEQKKIIANLIAKTYTDK